jgi:hypothetical protein
LLLSEVSDPFSILATRVGVSARRTPSLLRVSRAVPSVRCAREAETAGEAEWAIAAGAAPATLTNPRRVKSNSDFIANQDNRIDGGWNPAGIPLKPVNRE